eukprot:1185638-Pyramimonas_sp.AAC.1
MAQFAPNKFSRVVVPSLRKELAEVSIGNAISDKRPANRTRLSSAPKPSEDYFKNWAIERSASRRLCTACDRRATLCD